MITTLKTIFDRDLKQLKVEIDLYKNENKIWFVENEISNSAGNLCLHLIGNLNTYIGNVFGKTDYIRNRPQEFSLKNISKADLILKIEATQVVVEEALNKIKEDELLIDYPLLVFENKTSTEYMLIHLTTHLAYHLGQINYHRRLLDE